MNTSKERDMQRHRNGERGGGRQTLTRKEIHRGTETERERARRILAKRDTRRHRDGEREG